MAAPTPPAAPIVVLDASVILKWVLPPIARRSKPWLRRTLELTQRYGATFYDAAYHAHAIVERGVFVTADARYLQRAGERRLHHASLGMEHGMMRGRAFQTWWSAVPI